jgi:phosphatidylserine decarboxylase
MNKRSGWIAAEGYPFIIPTALVAMVFSFTGMFWTASCFYLLTIFIVWFFRNPERRIPGGDAVIVSPADGRILKIEVVDGGELIAGERQKICIFMNVFNVHVNRAPCSGTVSSIRYYPGKFLSADLDKASELNEKNAILIRSDRGSDILTVQIAGLIARRIVCWIMEGMYVKTGERIGMIRFGSRLEVFLPTDAAIHVQRGDKVKAGETVLGSLA